MNARLVIVGLAGALFGAGLAISGMTDPMRIIGFLDVTGAWDPTLVFVMVGAVFTVLTVNSKSSLIVFGPSLTKIVMSVVPVWPVAGVMTSERFVPVPLKARLLVGASVPFEDVP